MPLNHSDLHMLIGMDNYFKFVQGQKVTDGVYAVPSNLGTIIKGIIPFSDKRSNSTVTTVLEIATSTHESEDLIHKMWDLDSVGIKEPLDDHNLACRKFKESVVFSNGTYEASVPWADEKVELQSNKSLASQRLKSNWKYLLKDPIKLSRYDDVIREQLELGYIETVPGDRPVSERVHYLLHHCVHKDSKTTPLRIVFDCSAKQDKSKRSLNECLLTGPPLINDLISVLLKFRLRQFVCSADIEKSIFTSWHS